jgi:16S rRNA (guanine527-N7)-methyltransferase
VEQKLSLTSFVDFLHSQSIKLKSNQIESLDKYIFLIKSWNRKINLLSSKDEELIIQKHFLPSFYYVKMLGLDKVNETSSMLDVGSGAGFPGVILSIFYPKNSILLVDSLRKRALFLLKVINELNLSCNVYNGRVENALSNDDFQFDYIVARSVTNLETLCKWIRPLIKPSGAMWIMKGKNYKAERRNLPGAFIKIYEYNILEDWKEFSSYFENKIMLKVELSNDTK